MSGDLKFNEAASAHQPLMSLEQMRAVWDASYRWRSALAASVRLILLTATQRQEASAATWSEFDLNKRLWTVPAERMKGKAGYRRAHVVPFGRALADLLEEIPRRNASDYLFTASDGSRPLCWANGQHAQKLLASAGVEGATIHSIR